MQTAWRLSPPGCSEQFKPSKRFKMPNPNSIIECPPLPIRDGMEFRHCPNRLGYCVSDTGIVMGCSTQTRGRFTWHQLAIGHSKHAAKYATVTIPLNGKKNSAKVCILVLEAFVGPRPGKGYDACHGVLGPSDDSLQNVRWDTHSANGKDMMRDGTCGLMKIIKSGVRPWKRKLTAEQVKEIRDSYPDESMNAIARRLNIGRENVRLIINRRIYADIP